MLTSSGPKCDVCGHYILPTDPDERVNFFGVKGIEQELCCHNKCKETVLACGKDWEKLPLGGPLRKLFEEVTSSLPSGALCDDEYNDDGIGSEYDRMGDD